MGRQNFVEFSPVLGLGAKYTGVASMVDHCLLLLLGEEVEGSIYGNYCLPDRLLGGRAAKRLLRLVSTYVGSRKHVPHQLDYD